MKQQSGSVSMRVLPCTGRIKRVIGILTTEEEKDDTPFFKVLLQIITDNLKNAVNLINSIICGWFHWQFYGSGWNQSQ